jgi:hypothetical protein
MSLQRPMRGSILRRGTGSTRGEVTLARARVAAVEDISSRAITSLANVDQVRDLETQRCGNDPFFAQLAAAIELRAGNAMARIVDDVADSIVY